MLKILRLLFKMPRGDAFTIVGLTLFKDAMLVRGIICSFAVLKKGSRVLEVCIETKVHSSWLSSRARMMPRT